MHNTPVDVAKEIYRTRYWHPEFDQMPYVVGFQVFDGAINSCQTEAIK